MEEEESREELNHRIRKHLIEWFGPFEEFTDRITKPDGPKHGVIRSRMKSRSSPYVSSLQMAHDASPSHIPVHVALQSMRNLVEEPPLSALPTEFPGFGKKTPGTSGSNNGVEKNGKRRKMSSDEEGVGAKRKRESKIESSVTFSPDSGVHSTENDVESNTVETMLNIMTSLEEPRLSPISDKFLKEIKKAENNENRSQKRPEKKEEPEKMPEEPVKRKKTKFSTIFNDGDTSSSASTSREATPDVEVKKEIKEEKKEEKKERSLCSGHLRLKHLKTEKVQKLIELAKRQGKLSGDVSKKEENGNHKSDRSDRKEKEKEKVREKEKEKKESSVEKKEEPRRETPKPANKTVQQLAAKDLSKLSPSIRSPKSVASTMNTPTPSLLSRPSSSLSTHDPSSRTPKTMSMETKTPQTVKPARWSCQWEHAKLKSPQRLQIYDPTDPKIKSKAEFYHILAKSLKTKADKSTDRVLRPLHYMTSSIYFVMEAITRHDKTMCHVIYRDTHDLLGTTVIKTVRETDDAIAAHLLPRVKIVGQIMLSVMQYQMYMLRSESVLRTIQRLESREVADIIDIHPTASTSHSDHLSVPLPNKHVASVAHGTAGPSTSAGSTPSSTITTTASPWVQSMLSCPNSVTMPQSLFEVMKSQLRIQYSLALASRYWEDSKTLERIVDPSFIKHFETVCGKTIGMDMPFEHLAQFVLTAVASLEAEYTEEMKQPIRPTMDKVKTVLNIAMKTGNFYPSSDRAHRPSQSTPQLPPSTRTPTPSSLNLSSK